MACVDGTSVLLDAAESRAVDRRSIEECGVSGAALMAAAAAGAARVVRGRFPQARRVVVVAGSGHNGGDGFEVGRLLHQAGRTVTILRVASRPSAGDSAATLAAAIAAGVPVHEKSDGSIERYLADADLVVDALLGTGATGAPTGGVAAAIRCINAAKLPVVALDIPSGVDASTGEAPGEAISATVTPTFHAAKVGLRVMPGLLLSGTVIVIPIGAPVGPAGRVLSANRHTIVRPSRQRSGSKYDAGVVVVVGGSEGMSGAPAMAAAAALRAGAGLAIALVPAAVAHLVAARHAEVMVHGLSDAGDLPALAQRATALVIGPGSGRAGGADDVLRAALALNLPTVIDADALWWLACDPTLLAGRTAATVLTPHAGEAARLLGDTAADIANHRLNSARTLAQQSSAVCILKGADTLIAAPDGRLAVRAGDSTALATAGTGDVLAGLVGALLAQGADAFEAACAAVVIHLEAACVAAAQRGGAIMAGDLIGHLSVSAQPGSTT